MPFLSHSKEIMKIPDNYPSFYRKNSLSKRTGCQTVEKASQSFLRKQKIKLKTFSAGACTWQKILLRLQVWNLSAISRQMMRAADCKELAESPEGDFRQAQKR